VGEILQLMEEEKREVIKAYRDIRTIKWLIYLLLLLL
jgi:biotin synthase-related radical SAM superfamily protein